MAAAYRAPLAGSLFIAEVLFGTMMLASLGPVIISAVVALLVSNLINHSDALLYNVQLSLHRRYLSVLPLACCMVVAWDYGSLMAKKLHFYSD